MRQLSLFGTKEVINYENRKCCKWNCTNQLNVSDGMERWYCSAMCYRFGEQRWPRINRFMNWLCN